MARARVAQLNDPRRTASARALLAAFLDDAEAQLCAARELTPYRGWAPVPCRARPRTAKASVKPKTTSRRGATMTADHKAALATGRDEGRAIRRYLEALEANKPRRGRKRTRESVERQLAETLDRLTKASPLDRVQLLQRRLDLERELEAMSSGTDADLGELEAGFVAAAGPYSERKGLTYAAWREAGVDPRVLKQAGIS